MPATDSNSPQPVAAVAPAYVTAKDAATILDTTPWAVDRLCRLGAIESRLMRMVDVDSLREYAASQDGAAS